MAHPTTSRAAARLGPDWLARTLLKGLLVAGCAGLLSGCYAHAYVEPAYVEPVYVPPNVEVYPHYYYEGQTVYLIDNRWYTRHGDRWVYYRSEPEPLRRHRVEVYAAPRARPYEPVRVAPTRVAPRAAAPAYVAPPARERERRRDDFDRRRAAPRARDRR